LVTRIDQLLNCGHVWIWGPPGCGKTTLAAEYCERSSRPVLWYQVDATDRDPAEFFHHMAVAAGRGGSELPMLPTAEGDLRRFTQRFFAQLFELLPRDVLLVMHNHHDLPAASLLGDSLPAALASMPPPARLPVVSRQLPATPFVRFLAAGTLSVVDDQDLAFTESETALLARARELTEPGVAAQVHALSGGWAAGVALMLDHVQGRSRVGGAPEITREVTFGYFAAEVLQAVPAELRRSLLHTSVLPELTASMASELAGDAARLLLEQMSHQRLFINSRRRGQCRPGLDAAELVFHYQPLFRSFLSNELARAATPVEVTRLRQRAAQLAEQHGLEASAISLYAQTEDWNAAARMMRHTAPALLGQGRAHAVLECTSALPRDVLERDAWLLYWRGVASLPESLGEARRCFDQARELSRSGDDITVKALVLAGLVTVNHYEGFTHEGNRALVDELDALALEDGLLPPPAEFAVVSAFLFAATWTWCDHPRLPGSAARLRALLQEPREPNQRILSASALLLYYTMAGQFDDAKRLMALIDPLLADPGVTAMNRALWLCYTGNVTFAFDMPASAHLLQEALAVARRHHIGPVMFLSTAFLAVRAVWHRDEAEALAHLASLESMVPWGRPLEEGQYHVMACEVAQMRHQAELAAYHARRAWQLACSTNATLLRIIWGNCIAPALVESGDLGLAAQILDRALALSRSTPFRTYESLQALNRAFLELKQGDLRGCRENLSAGINYLRSNPELMMATRNLCAAVPPLFAFALEEGIETTYVQDLIRRWALEAPAGAPYAWPWPIRIRVLGELRIEVDGQEVSFQRKAPARLLEMLKLLVAAGGRDVSQDWLTDRLWPESDGAQGAQAFTNALHRLRKLLGRDDALLLRDGRLSLNDKLCWLDLWMLHELAGEADHLLAASAVSAARVAQLSRRLLDAYRGVLFIGDGNSAELARARDRAASMFERVLMQTGELHERQGDWRRAADLYRRGLELDAVNERLYRRLIRCCRELGEHAEAIATYRRCETMLTAVLGARPSEETRRLAEA
jgi:ATP/maltotriose-dependent transcriptional regulator MalT/DNA-binding SARP family transcriptional activator